MIAMPALFLIDKRGRGSGGHTTISSYTVRPSTAQILGAIDAAHLERELKRREKMTRGVWSLRGKRAVVTGGTRGNRGVRRPIACSSSEPRSRSRRAMKRARRKRRRMAGKPLAR